MSGAASAAVADSGFGDVEIAPEEVIRERKIGLGVYG